MIVNECKYCLHVDAVPGRHKLCGIRQRHEYYDVCIFACFVFSIQLSPQFGPNAKNYASSKKKVWIHESNLDAYSLGHSELYSSGISGVIDFETRKLGFFYLIEMKKKNVES